MANKGSKRINPYVQRGLEKGLAMFFDPLGGVVTNVESAFGKQHLSETTYGFYTQNYLSNRSLKGNLANRVGENVTQSLVGAGGLTALAYLAPTAFVVPAIMGAPSVFGTFVEYARKALDFCEDKYAIYQTSRNQGANAQNPQAQPNQTPQANASATTQTPNQSTSSTSTSSNAQATTQAQPNTTAQTNYAPQARTAPTNATQTPNQSTSQTQTNYQQSATGRQRGAFSHYTQEEINSMNNAQIENIRIKRNNVVSRKMREYFEGGNKILESLSYGYDLFGVPIINMEFEGAILPEEKRKMTSEEKSEFLNNHFKDFINYSCKGVYKNREKSLIEEWEEMELRDDCEYLMNRVNSHLEEAHKVLDNISDENKPLTKKEVFRNYTPQEAQAMDKARFKEIHDRRLDVVEYKMKKYYSGQENIDASGSYGLDAFGVPIIKMEKEKFRLPDKVKKMTPEEKSQFLTDHLYDAVETTHARVMNARKKNPLSRKSLLHNIKVLKS